MRIIQIAGNPQRAYDCKSGQLEALIQTTHLVRVWWLGEGEALPYLGWLSHGAMGHGPLPKLVGQSPAPSSPEEDQAAQENWKGLLCWGLRLVGWW